MTVPGFSNRQANAAFGAQSLAVFAAQRVERKLQSHRIDYDWIEVDLIVDDAMNLVLVGRIFGHAVRIREQLGEVHVHGSGHGLEAARALPGRVGANGTCDQNTFGYSFEPEIQLDGCTHFDSDRVEADPRRRFHRPLDLLHRPRSATEVVDIQYETRIRVGTRGTTTAWHSKSSYSITNFTLTDYTP